MITQAAKKCGSAPCVLGDPPPAGEPVKDLTKAVQAALGNGSNASALLEDEVEEEDEEADEQIEEDEEVEDEDEAAETEEDEQIDEEDADEVEDEEGKPAMLEEEVGGNYKCIDKWKRCTDTWCNNNCNHNPRYCPPSYCRGVAAPVPPPAPKPAVIEKCPAGSFLGTSFFNEARVNVHHAYKLVCCAASCGACGGSGCAHRPGGSKVCCAQRITQAATKCGKGSRGRITQAPCVLGDPPPAEEPVYDYYK